MTDEYRSRIIRFNARAIIDLFYRCYKHGVCDASELCDENRCVQYIERMRSAHVYRLVSQNFDIDWKEWRVRMMLYASEVKRLREKLRLFLMDIRSYGPYYSVPLRIGMDFYVNGVDDYTKYPANEKLELFLAGEDFTKWKRGFEKAPYRKINDIFEEMQIVLFDRARADLTVTQNFADGSKMALTDRTYMAFLDAMFLCLQNTNRKKWWKE